MWLTYDTVRLDLMGLRDTGTSVSDNLSDVTFKRAGRYELDSGKSSTDSSERDEKPFDDGWHGATRVRSFLRLRAGEKGIGIL